MDEAVVDRLVAETRRHFDEVAESLRSDVRSDMQKLRSDVQSDIQGLRGEVRSEMEQLRTVVRADMDQLRAETRQEAAETRRHFDVVAEGLRGDVQQIAEGLSTLTSRFDRFQVEVKEEFREVRSMIKLSYTELDRRLTGLETSVHSLEARVDRLEKTA